MIKNLTKIWLGNMKRVLHSRPKPEHEASWNATVEPFTTPFSKAPLAKERESPIGPAQGTWTRNTHPMPPTADHLTHHLTYGLYVPPNVRTTGLPLVVMLHGCKQDIDQFARGTRMNLLADQHHFAVLYPEQSRHPHGCWHWFNDSESGGRGEARAVATLIDTLISQHGFDATRVYAAGLSAGAGLTALLALYFPHYFAAVAMHSGPAFGEAHSSITAMDVMRRGVRQNPAALADACVELSTYPGMPSFILHGNADYIVAPQNAKQLTIEFLRLNNMTDASGMLKNAQAIETECNGALTRDYLQDGRLVVRTCDIPKLGHAWSGGDGTVPFHASSGPDASALIWSFFAPYRRSTA